MRRGCNAALQEEEEDEDGELCNWQPFIHARFGRVDKMASCPTPRVEDVNTAG